MTTADSTTTRNELHELIDQLPEAELDRAKRVLAAATDDPVLRSLLLAEYDEEPVTEEERAAIEQANIGKAEFIPWDEAMKQLGR